MQRSTFDLDAASLSRFQKAMEELSSARKAYGTPAGMQKLMRNEMRLIISRLIQFTPPQTSKGGKKAGERAVERDIRKVFIDVEAMVRFSGENLPLDLASRYGDAALAQRVISTIDKGPLRGASVLSAPDPSMHAGRRNRRGRVNESGERAFVLSPESVASYIKKIQAHVGKAKSGWNAAAARFGVKGVGAWVKRHGTTGGSAQDTMASNPDGYLVAINSRPSILSLNAQSRIIESAFNSRTKAIELKAKRILEAAIKKANARK